MKEFLEEFEQYAIDVILNRRKGVKATVLRAFLRGLSFLYRGIVSLRLAFYRNRVLRERNIGCLVVSIGNLTVGGTGKTPVVEKLARALQDGGRKVAILSRGYKSEKPPVEKPERRGRNGKRPETPPRVVSDGKKIHLDSRQAGDEPYMLANNLPDVVVVVDKDRVKAGLHAIKEFEADTLVLDDGLQYLKLKHRLDIVLVDRQAPFGNDRLLPRGTLREPPRSLRRASYIFLTKCNGEPNDDLIRRIRKYNKRAEIVECTHKPKYLQNLITDERLPLSILKDQYVAAISGIAVPESFENGLRKLGARVELSRRFADHHRFKPGEVYEFVDRAVHRDMDMVVTTEKDSVRFPKFETSDLPIYFMRVEIEILKGEESFNEFVQRICKPVPMTAAKRYF